MKNKQQNTKVNWDEIKMKVNFQNEAIEKGDILTPEEKRSILKSRAKALATEKQDEISKQDFIEIIEFRLGSENYAFETEYVREVYLLNNFTPIPGLPAFVVGIVNIRGQILSIIDLKSLFNLPLAGLGELNKIIILKNENMEFGVLADIIIGTHSVSLSSLNKSYAKMPGIGAEYLKGVSSEHLIILNAESILEDEKIIINQL